jgi:hypothetical protein
MAHNASGAQRFAEQRDEASIVRTGTEDRQGEVVRGKSDLLVWTAAFVMVILLALLVAY